MVMVAVGRYVPGITHKVSPGCKAAAPAAIVKNGLSSLFLKPVPSFQFLATYTTFCVTRLVNTHGGTTPDPGKTIGPCSMVYKYYKVIILYSIYNTSPQPAGGTFVGSPFWILNFIAVFSFRIWPALPVTVNFVMLSEVLFMRLPHVANPVAAPVKNSSSVVFVR